MGGSFLSPDKRDCLLIPSQLSAVLKQVVACFRTCLTKNGSQRGRAPAGQRPQPPSGGAWPRPATQHRPPPLAGAPSGDPGAGSRPTAYWWGISDGHIHVRPSVFLRAFLRLTPPQPSVSLPDSLFMQPCLAHGSQQGPGP